MTPAPAFTKLCTALNSAYESTKASSPASSTNDAAMDTLGSVPTHLRGGAGMARQSNSQQVSPPANKQVIQPNQSASPSSQVKSSQVRSSQVSSSQVNSSRVKSSQVKSGQVRSSQVKSSQVKSGRFSPRTCPPPRCVPPVSRHDQYLPRGHVACDAFGVSQRLQHRERLPSPTHPHKHESI